MAQATTNRFAGRVLGAGLALSAAAFPAAAQDATPAAQSLDQVDTILCETDYPYYTKDGWTPETADLNCAVVAANEYAENNPGVGVLIHVGKDIPNARFPTPESFGQAVVDTFRSQHGVDAAYFLTQNDARATGMEFYIGPYTHGADNGTELKNVTEAFYAMPEVAALLRVIWEDKLAAAQQMEAPAPNSGG